MARESWDEGKYDWERATDEDAHPAWDDSEGSDDDADLSDLPQVEAGNELAKELPPLQNRGVLSAKNVCVLRLLLAGRAGAQGFVNKLAFKPSSLSGHFQRHLDVVLLEKDERIPLYSVCVPGHNRYDKARVEHRIETLPLHEQIASEVANTPGIKARLKTLVDKGEWARDYYEHPIVTAHPDEVVFPLSLYVDGVAHSKVDNVLGITITNMVTGTRHLCVALRKSLCCRCGCRSWCTLRPIWA